MCFTCYILGIDLLILAYSEDILTGVFEDEECVKIEVRWSEPSGEPLRGFYVCLGELKVASFVFVVLS